MLSNSKGNPIIMRRLKEIQEQKEQSNRKIPAIKKVPAALSSRLKGIYSPLSSQA
jgi:hypothetical protein